MPTAADSDSPSRDENARTICPLTIPDYDLLRRIGSGSYGDVWLARNVLGQCRAVKIIYRSRFSDPRPFEREFEGIQRFEPISRSHPSQLHILHVGKNDAAGCFYYVMELADDADVAAGVPPAVEGGVSPPGPASTTSSASIHHGPIPPGGTPGSTAGEDARRYIPHTLRFDLEQRGRLLIPDCVQIGLSLATALAHLHERGLVHRDIKPSNIIFVNGVAKLGDIGLVTAAGDTQSIVGTEGYLPPEGPGTPQADVFSLGKVLYEMSTGMDRRRFAELPADLREWPDRSAVFEFNSIVLRACAKDPAQRYQSAEQLRADLALLQRGASVRQKRATQHRLNLARKVSIAAAVIALLVTGTSLLWHRFNGSTVPRFNGVPELNSLAVLPFVNENTNWAPHEYLCNSLTDETMNALTNCAGLRVAPRAAVFAFKGTTNDLRQIGERLGVRTVLAGSMKRTSNQLHVAARLLYVANGAELWSSSYDRPWAESAAVGSDVARNVAGLLHVKLPEAALSRLEANLVHKLAAYQIYKQASTNMASRESNTQDGFYRTIELLNQTLAEDQGFAQAYADLADTYANAALWLLPPGQAMNEAKKNALRALQIEDTLPKAHIALGLVFLNHELDPLKAEAHFRHAIVLAPRDGRTYGYCAIALSTLGRFDEADQVLKEGEQVDPENNILLTGECLRYYCDHHYEDLLRQSAQVLTFQSNSTVGLMWRAKAHERLGQYAEALVIAQRLKQLDPAPDVVALLGLIHARMGHGDEAEKALEELRVFAQGRRGSPIFDAQVLVGLGKNDLAIEKLQQAVSDYPPTVLHLKTDPLWDELRSDRRFAALTKRMGLEK